MHIHGVGPAIVEVWGLAVGGWLSLDRSGESDLLWSRCTGTSLGSQSDLRMSASMPTAGGPCQLWWWWLKFPVT